MKGPENLCISSPGKLTCKPAGTAGYWPALAAAVPAKCPKGCSTQSEAIWEKTVLLTRQQQRPAALAAAIAGNGGIIDNNLYHSSSTGQQHEPLTSEQPLLLRLCQGDSEQRFLTHKT